MGKKKVVEIMKPIKTCKQCGDVKLVSGFKKDKKGRLGVSDICNKCLEDGEG